MYAKHKKSLLTKEKVQAYLEKDVCISFKVKNKLGMFE